MQRAERVIVIVCLILLGAGCRDSTEPTARGPAHPLADVIAGALPLPAVSYSTYLGGGGDEGGAGIAVDGSGNAYVTGSTTSTDFPTTAGTFQTAPRGTTSVFVTKLSPAGTGLVYSTYLGGSGSDGGNAIAVDGAGDAYLTGSTTSPDFPTTPGAFQTTYLAGGAANVGLGCVNEAFVTKLNPTGTGLVYSTYLGGNVCNFGLAIAVDAAGSAYVTGGTGSNPFSNDFPTTPGAFQSPLDVNCGDECAFVTKLNPSGNGLVYSTALGPIPPFVFEISQGNAIAVDGAGNAYVGGRVDGDHWPTTPGAFQTTGGAGSDGFVTKLNPLGTGLVYSTYILGSECDEVNGIAVDGAGDAYVTGQTTSPDFPTTPGAFQSGYIGVGGGGCGLGVGDAFVTELNPSGSGLLYSTYLGGGSSFGTGIAIDGVGDAYVTGFTNSPNFPTTAGAPQTTFGGGTDDAFLTKLNPSGTGLIYSTYLGGSADDRGAGVALDRLLNPSGYVTGITGSTNFPTTSGAVRTSFAGGSVDGFVTKITTPAYSTAVGHTFLQPINMPPQAMSVFKIGSTIPVKFQLFALDGVTAVTTAHATIQVNQVTNGEANPVNETVVSTVADQGINFRYDVTSQQYVFNLGTKSWVRGVYRITANLDDGSTIVVDVGAR